MPKKSVPFDNLTRGHQFDGGPFALDLYRLLGMVLSDKQIASLGDETSYLMQPIWLLQERFRKAELLRILVSSAVALRILFDQKRDPREQRFETVSRKPCGFLWPNLPKRQREVLTIREACNKIIHATDVIEDEVNSDWRQTPINLGCISDRSCICTARKTGLIGAQSCPSSNLHWAARISSLTTWSDT
jgi:hypothetical protein